MPKKLTYEEVKSYIESYGYQLLSEEYKGAFSKLKIICPYGHEYEVNFGNFKSGKRCPICANKNRNDKKKLSYEKVNSYIDTTGETLLSKEYINSGEKLEIKCTCGNIYYMSWDNFKAGHRCPKCAVIRTSNKQRNSLEDVKKYIESMDGYKLLSNRYINNDAKLEIKCPEGHIFHMTLHGFKSGHRCPKCNHKNISKRMKFSYNYVKSYYEYFGYKFMDSFYESSSYLHNVKCPYGHEYKIRWDNFKSGTRCPFCEKSRQFSKAEKEILSYIDSIYDGKLLPNNKDTIKNPNTGYYLELDIYLPEINKAIEYNGSYWHSFPERKLCDYIKKEQCRNKNIDLLIIKEEDWINDKEICIKVIGNFIK